MKTSDSTTPTVGLFGCFSAASNTGSLTAMACLQVTKRLGSDVVGICSLPALLNHVPRQSSLVKRLPHVLVVDGCNRGCARELLAGVHVTADAYLNLEADLGIHKLGPFTSHEFDDEQLEAVTRAIAAAVEALAAVG